MNAAAPGSTTCSPARAAENAAANAAAKKIAVAGRPIRAKNSVRNSASSTRSTRFRSTSPASSTTTPAVELWDRYKRGERNVFTRRLYTAQGQKTFEEIRRKYRRSTEFRETVDRYVDEFERLLEQVARDDRGQVLTKTYLTSDTGKVYTLLAHAAGRLG